MKVFLRLFIFIILVTAGKVQAQVNCPPSSFTATPGIENVSLSWENPGFYYGTPELSTGDSSYYTGSVDNLTEA